MISSDIEEKMKNENSFMGCYAKDKLPKTFPKILPKTMIINTGHSSTHGEHWVALLLLKNSCFYFDSFGLGILDQEIQDFIERKYKIYTSNQKCIQHFESKKCGEFCIGFTKMVKNRLDFEKFILNFDFQNLKKNDKKIDKILRNMKIKLYQTS